MWQKGLRFVCFQSMVLEFAAYIDIFRQQLAAELRAGAELQSRLEKVRAGLQTTRQTLESELRRAAAATVQLERAARLLHRWHRTLRKKRSRARKRILSHRLAGDIPWQRDIRLLERHHSAPKYLPLSRLHMGRREKWANNWSDRGYHKEQDQRPWRLWSGSWSASPQGRTNSHTRYDRVQLPTEKPTREEPGEIATSHRAEWMREIQKMVTTARKADGRIRKLKEEIAKREMQWKVYEKQKRAEFLEQKQNFQNDMKKLQEEIDQANQQGVDASEEVQELVAKGVKPKPASAEEADAWEELLTAGDGQEATGFLRDALTAAGQVRPVPTTSAPAHGDGRFLNPADAARVLAATLSALPPGFDIGHLYPANHQGQAMPPSVPPFPPPDVEMPDANAGMPVNAKEHNPAYTTLSPGAGRSRPAPYPPTSPVNNAPSMETPAEKPDKKPATAGHPGQRNAGQVRVPTNVEAPRQTVKDATKTPPAKPPSGSLDIQDKLDQKRAAMGGPALRPFRQTEGAHTAHSATEAPVLPTQGLSVKQKAAIFEEDDEEEPPGKEVQVIGQSTFRLSAFDSRIFSIFFPSVLGGSFFPLLHMPWLDLQNLATRGATHFACYL
ncbi:unnamed protein product [Symbiodinium sp. KB8]|nr:unnamed protein product [Symbiodinium sp. KB8]